MVVVGDIDRGGVLAALYGTWALVSAADRAHLAGYVVSKFRGDRAVLEPGLAELSRRTGLPCLGVLPWLEEVWIDGEDALDVARWKRAGLAPERPDLVVAVVPLPRISNATDVEALARTRGVRVDMTAAPDACAAADLLVLPGTRATIDDLAWLRARGLDAVVAARHATGRPTLGICGGYEMLARTITDGVESGHADAAGLGVLPVDVRFGTKVTARTTHAWRGLAVPGYEIHHGHVTLAGDAEPFLDGCRVGVTFGTMLHGAFEDQPFADAFLAEVAAHTGSRWTPTPGPAHAAARESMLDAVAAALESHVDLDALVALARAGVVSGEAAHPIGCRMLPHLRGRRGSQ